MLAPTDPDAMSMMAAQPPVGGVSLPAPPRMFDVKLKRCIKSGQLKVRVLPPEDFLTDPNALRVHEDEGRFFGDVVRMTRSAAKLKWPKKAAVIDDLPAYTLGVDEGQEKQARESRYWSYKQVKTDKATEEVEIFETYVNVDYDGDGIAEWRQVCAGGLYNDRQILSNEEWSGPLPYVSITPAPMPHRYRGRSLYDDVGPVQRVKTVLMRQMNDNLYLVNNPMLIVNGQAIEQVSKDRVENPEIGGCVWSNGAPAETVFPLTIPYIGDKVMAALEYWDMTLEKRTGVSRSTMALDSDALQYQTATAVNEQRAAAFTKVEMYARNIAECGGFKELFSKLLKLFVQNQKSVKYIQIKGQMVPMDPRGWNADMRVQINIGLGAGSRDRDMAMLGGIAAKQELSIQGLQSPFNPICNVGHLFETYRKMAETGGLKNPEQFFPDITQEQVAQFAQQAQQSQQPPPEVMKIQAQLAIEDKKIAADQQRDANRAQLDQAQFQQKAQVEQVQAQADIATKQKELEAKVIADREKAQLDMALAERKFALEKQKMLLDHQLKIAVERAKIAMAPKGADANGNQIPGDREGALDDFDGQVMPQMRQERTSREQAKTAAMSELAKSLQQLAASISAPNEILRGPDGRVTGSQKRLN